MNETTDIPGYDYGAAAKSPVAMDELAKLKAAASLTEEASQLEEKIMDKDLDGMTREELKYRVQGACDGPLRAGAMAAVATIEVSAGGCPAMRQVRAASPSDDRSRRRASAPDLLRSRTLSTRRTPRLGCG